jgi:hypothetical protein
LAAADRTLRTAWESRNPNLTEEMRAFIFPEDAVADPSTVEDRQTVRGLFVKGKKGAQAKSAETIFGKYPTVVQGLDHIAELRSRDKNLTKIIDNKALDSETLVDPETGTALDYGNALDFFEQGIVGNTGANAAKWVKANLSPEAKYYLRARIEQLKASEEAIKKRTTLDDPVAIARSFRRTLLLPSRSSQTLAPVSAGCREVWVEAGLVWRLRSRASTRASRPAEKAQAKIEELYRRRGRSRCIDDRRRQNREFLGALPSVQDSASGRERWMCRCYSWISPAMR